ncbi:unnamed protein product [Musa acuminata subsp. burmannicoides]
MQGLLEGVPAMEMGSSSVGVSGASSGSSDSLHGLKFGKKIYFEDGGGNSSKDALAPASVAAPPPPPTKKMRGVVKGGLQQPPRCQVDGCKVDLTGAKTYYCKHKVCGMHSKAPKVTVAGLEQRFCQQCSRFHQLPEFDQGKRSCRRRLAGHNERRRKPPPPGPFASRHCHHTPSFHEELGRARSFPVDFSCPRFSTTTRDVWPTIAPGDWVAGNHCLGVLYPLSSGAMVHGAHPCMHGHLEGPLYSITKPPLRDCLSGASDSSCALSLLSTQPWNHNTARNQVPTISVSSCLDGTPMARSTVSDNCMTRSWGFIGHGGRPNPQNIQHIAGGVGRVAEVGDGQISGMLELARHGDGQCLHGSSGTAYDESGQVMRWSL